jgi:hypothetical protein
LRRVNIVVHHVKNPSTSLTLDLSAIRRLYWTAGIDLMIEEEADVKFDPASNPARPYSSYVERYGKSAADRGHLIIGRKCPRAESEIAGELIDLDRRGVGAVYTKSPYISDYGDLGLLQSAAHEIGHMLNLSHTKTGFVSTMNQADVRKKGIVTNAWTEAEAEADKEKASGRPAYYFALSQPTECYPLSLNSRIELNTMSDIRMLPWGGKFEHELEA